MGETRNSYEILVREPEGDLLGDLGEDRKIILELNYTNRE